MPFLAKAFALTLATLPLSLQAQDWPNLDAVLFQTLANKPEHVEGSYFFPNHPDPAQATEALGFVYEWIEGSAGSVSIAVGRYALNQPGPQFTYLGPISQIWGHGPRDAAFYPDRIEVTLTTLKDGEPRCCPTGETRYTIDRTTGSASTLWTR